MDISHSYTTDKEKNSKQIKVEVTIHVAMSQLCCFETNA